MKTPPTIIYTHGGGRLGNQIIRHAHWLAWVRANDGKVAVVNLAFWPFSQFFEPWQRHPGCGFPFYQDRADHLARLRGRLPDGLREWGDRGHHLSRAVHAMGRYWPGGQAIALDDSKGEQIDLAEPELLSRVNGHRVTTLSGWKIASWRLFAEQEKELRQFFKPAAAWSREPANFIAHLRERYDLLVGIFIRQSDYQVWQDGRFHFPTASYAGWMRQILDLYPGRRVGFVIASEEKQKPALFDGLPSHFATGTVNQGGHWFGSWLELSMCDVIVSPPSTFSATAAFLGERPIWPLVEVNQVMALAQIIPHHLLGAARHPVFSLAVK